MNIVGVCLVKNEDWFIERVLRNALHLCDHIILLDNDSDDDTAEIARTVNRVEVRSVADVTNTHRHVEPFVGTDTWVFGVDGDEIYAPDGLRSGDRYRKGKMTTERVSEFFAPCT